MGSPKGAFRQSDRHPSLVSTGYLAARFTRVFLAGRRVGVARWAKRIENSGAPGWSEVL